jgi:hypothetical protein
MGTELNPPADWVAALQRQAQLEPAQAEAAVRASLRFLATRLPSPLFGAIQAQLAADAAAAAGEDGASGVKR